ncbi:MAG: carbamoyl-phosphate synthase large subunit, partial [Ktedonobacteraceae bacterium]|nr:carbamoyl-phosphate synthase large subunit [Ktedonobacteraceae bacterium]
EDRELFKRLLLRIGEPVPPSASVTQVDDARAFADEIGFPLIVRPSFTLGGTGGGIATTEAELEAVVARGLASSPIQQVLVEQYLVGWKEIEYEVMRDANDTCVTVCNMENIDPMGVHTGDSIVVAPSQTLSDKEYHLLRSAAFKIIRALGVEGGCNVQFALDPRSSRYYVIEVNPRVSRSSALASKATGYPIARVAAKIALGKRLDEITNAATGRTCAAFEPALDYVVVKIPRWPFDKFPQADRHIGTQMKATGEVMAIERTFEAALQKAVRALELDGRGLLCEPVAYDEAFHATDQRLWQLMAALRVDCSSAMLDHLHHATGIDIFFLLKLRRLVEMERRLHNEPLSPLLLRAAKRLGFSDRQIAILSGSTAETIRSERLRCGIRPVFKMVDTCAGEFAAQTAYFYSTYAEENEALPLGGPSALVLGSGPIRIGQGIEFDYCSVQAARALHLSGWHSIMVNSNPETVSTDFDLSDRLYFEPLDEESVRDILENEASDGGTRASPTVPLMVQFGGQTAINLAGVLTQHWVEILGTSIEGIDAAEDRRQFQALLARLGLPSPTGRTVNTLEGATATAQEIGYPLLVRPSYVLGGRAMEIVYDRVSLERYVRQALKLYGTKPLLIDSYLAGKEVEVDLVCDGKEVLIPGIMEHIERAGIHSGDSSAVYPPITLTQREIETITRYSTDIALALGVRGLLNAQYVVTNDGVFVLEVNPRASRTVPFLSKATGVP